MKVWITGIGIVSPLAPTSRATMARLCDGKHAFGPVTLFDTSGQRSQIAAEVQNLRIEDVLPQQGKHWSRTDALALIAAQEALREARLSTTNSTIDLVFGTTTGATLETEDLLPDFATQPSTQDFSPDIINPLALSLDHVALGLGPFRRRRLVSSACSTGATLLMLAGAWLRNGMSQCVLAGASDSLCRLTFTGFNSLGSLDTRPCRPFDATRAGLGLGEGAAFFVLETETHAKARGAQPIVELTGWAASAEAHHITNPDPEGKVATRTMLQALQCAGLQPSDIDYVNTHGTATILNDPMEVRAIRNALGNAFDQTFISSVKGQIGHCLGAAGAIETAVAALAIEEERIPPTVGLSQPDKDCVANHVIDSFRPITVRAAMSNSFGFGGLDGVVIVSKPGFAPPPTAPIKRVWVQGGAMTLHSSHWTTASEPLALTQPVFGPLDDSSMGSLDTGRARRLARAERLLASTVLAIDIPKDNRSTGLIAGKISGNPEATSRFLERIRQRGPRFASPADFPNLMLSSLVGHTSIYHGLQGPALTTCGLTHPGTSCLLTTYELIATGTSDRLIAGAVEPWDMTAVARAKKTQRSEAAAAILLDSDPTQAIASLRFLNPQSPSDWPFPTSDARVLHTSGANTAILQDSPWKNIVATPAESFTGHHDASQVGAVLVAASFIASGQCERVLVCLADEDCTLALCLEKP